MSTDEFLTESNGIEEIEVKIASLKSYINTIHQTFETLREQILDLAKKLDEDKICKEDEICNKIKEYLKDEIQKGKITSRWIEQCLPKEYKRKYEKVKSELTSVSPETKKLLVNTDGSTYYEKESVDNYKIQVDSPKEFESQNQENSQISGEQYFQKSNSPFQTEDITKILEFRIRKDRENQIKEAFDKSKEYIIITLGGSKEIISIESDTVLKDIKDIDKYYYDDNDTNHDGESS